ncbi:hypothetical protein LPU83_pLPU83c_0618 (plasmid) [Rhizobium favelukesii]|uniref:Uncharacterized protein n=1 Tax=Rhizobium favelukesii TaxID=348824 RepID=W6RLS2_9HYPH|nr:hypothetical protein LPU83_pLPU83c_0618 [Rhizobium favelukesii]
MLDLSRGLPENRRAVGGWDAEQSIQPSKADHPFIPATAM